MENSESLKQSAYDDKIARIIFPVIAIIVLYWIGTGVVKLYDWIASLGPYQSWWWISVGKFLWRNFSIVLIIYTIICLQTAGLAEFKFGKVFVKAFLLSLFITPPLMMLFYAKPHARSRKINERKNQL